MLIYTTVLMSKQMQDSIKPIHDPIVRKAAPGDATTILKLIDALAAYEHLTPPNDAAKKRLIGDMFSVRPRIEPYLCEINGIAAGYALVFETYSSFLALPTLTWKISLYCRNSAIVGRAMLCLWLWFARQTNGVAEEWNGLSWTGTNWPWDFTAGSMQSI